MHMITSTARRPNGGDASTRSDSDSEPVERSTRGFEVHVKTRSLALERSIEQQGRVIDNDDGEVEALRLLVRLPWITQQHFVGMLQARRIDQVDVYFLFERPWFYL